jgi:CBS domain-containing protein
VTELNYSCEVQDVALSLEQTVVLRPNDMFRTAVEKMSKKRLGIACVVDKDDTFMGVFTDGDIRRLLLSDHKPIAALFAEDISQHMTRNPKTTTPGMKLREAISLMEHTDVYDLPVVDGDGRLTGVLHMHAAIKALFGL